MKSDCCSSDSDFDYEREMYMAKKRVKKLLHLKKVKDHERLKRKKIEEYERNRAEKIRMGLDTYLSQGSNNAGRQDGRSSDASR